MSSPKKLKPIPRSVFDLEEVAPLIFEKPAQIRGDIVFTPSIQALSSLPPRPVEGNEWTRTINDWTLSVMAPLEVGLPFGYMARACLIYLATEAVKLKKAGQQDPRDIYMGKGVGESAALILGSHSRSGGERGTQTKLRASLRSLSGTTLMYQHSSNRTLFDGEKSNRWRIKNYTFIDWHAEDRQDLPFDLVGRDSTRWRNFLRLSESFYKDVIETGVPLDRLAISRFYGNCMQMDIYMWATHKAFVLQNQGRSRIWLSWKTLREQFGPNYADIRFFRRRFLEEFAFVSRAYPKGSIYMMPNGDGDETVCFTLGKTHVMSAVAEMPAPPALATLPAIPEADWGMMKPSQKKRVRALYAKHAREQYQSGLFPPPLTP